MRPATLLSIATAAVALPCLVLVFGREVLTALQLEWAPGTWLTASPRKAQALLWLAGTVSIVATPLALLQVRDWPRVHVVVVLVAFQVALFAAPALVRNTVNPGLAALAQRFDISEVEAPLSAEWSDPQSAARRLEWTGFANAVAREAAKEAASLTLPGWASGTQTRQAIATMHLVSRLWAPGNRMHPERAGCVRDNEDIGFKFVGQEQTTHATYLGSRIACCDDYAHMLHWLLRRAGLDSRVIVAGGHVFVEARLDGQSRVLDAMANVVVNASWDEINTGRKAALLMLPHAATRNGSIGFRPQFAADRWRLIAGIFGGGLAWRERLELPPEFPH